MLRVMKSSKFLIFSSAFLGLIALTGMGCNSLSDSEKQLADINGKASADRQIQANNQDLDKHIDEAKQELAIRQRFYQGVAGTFEGLITRQDGSAQNLNTRMILTPTVPEYDPDRYRTLDELQNDLKNLALNVEVVQWDPDTGSTWGCFFTNAVPDLNDGTVRLQPTQASDCPIAYKLWLMPAGANNGGAAGAAVAGNSSAIASSLLSEKMSSASALAVEMDPIKDQHILHFVVKRAGNP